MCKKIGPSDARSKIIPLPRYTGSCASKQVRYAEVDDVRKKKQNKLNSKRKVINRQSYQTRQAGSHASDRILLGQG